MADLLFYYQDFPCVAHSKPTAAVAAYPAAPQLHRDAGDPCSVSFANSVLPYMISDAASATFCVM